MLPTYVICFLFIVAQSGLKLFFDAKDRPLFLRELVEFIQVYCTNMMEFEVSQNITYCGRKVDFTVSHNIAPHDQNRTVLYFT